MYRKDTYKYYSHCATYTGKEKVLPDFLADVTFCTPSSVRVYGTRFVIWFGGKKYQEKYTLPLNLLHLVNPLDMIKEGD